MARLTKRVVDAAQAEGSRWTWLGDDEVPGFGALIYPSGRKTFALRYRTRSGRQRMLKLGQYGELTVQEARDMARKEKVRVLDGEDPRTEREREAAGIATVADLMDRWIEEHAKAGHVCRAMVQAPQVLRRPEKEGQRRRPFCDHHRPQQVQGLR